MNIQAIVAFATIENGIIAGIFILGTVLSWRSGAGRVAALILAGILSSPMAALAKDAWILRDIIPSLSALVVFVVLFALIAFLFDRLMRSDLSGGLPIPAAAIAGLASVAGLTAVWAHSETLLTLRALPEILQPPFAEPYIFWWVVGSLITLLILSR